MDENLLNLLQELSLKSAFSDDENCCRQQRSQSHGSNYASSSNVSSPSNEPYQSSDEDPELKNAVNCLLTNLEPSTKELNQQCSNADSYDKSKLLLALLSNNDLVTSAIKKINHLISLGKQMEQIYRRYYVDPTIYIDLKELCDLITEFDHIYNSEKFIRDVNVTRVYRAYFHKLVDIYQSRQTTSIKLNSVVDMEDQMYDT